MASTSRRRHQIVDEEEEMDVSHGEAAYSDKHKLLLMYLMHARMVTKMELAKVHGKLFNKTESLTNTLSVITKKISALRLDIREVKADVGSMSYIVIFNTTSDSFFPRCSNFNKNQLEYLKKILTGIVLSDVGFVGKIEALNSCEVLSKSDAEQTIRQFVKAKILIEGDQGGLCLTPLAVVELEPFFKNCFPENISTCDLCQQLVFIGSLCGGCGNKFHFHCVERWRQSGKCPNCKDKWPVDMDEDTE